MSNQWKSFWDGYRTGEARSESDLFVQVGKTVARQRIPIGVFARMVERVVERLEIGSADHVLDMCCGNGLISYELAMTAGYVTAVDFAEHLIGAARIFKASPNIDYRVGDVTLPVARLIGDTADSGLPEPEKFLMNDALAYFEPESLDTILGNILVARGKKPFSFYLTGIPNAALKWNFYDTDERRRSHLENVRNGDITNEGIGRWWSAAEIEEICKKRGLLVSIEDQPLPLSNYRMDALIWRR
ncbi:class I SAM-dependent methyltransferase [Pseudoxanthomonas sp. PXM01]|uniref:class I SAM-dependent methyltransferase n=1 Tax=Pseudoxanthomonas sp. PXM01 TaxID=2769295 RepID=UPI00177EB862|nr:class I SAM-dependent methyltransferase [Pseudoxanthomonas sp. PXM01]MBD9470567.1 class I SAM-dependent methyltransferase [Pseudoxanthomonas sp. PXM01]